MQDGAFKFVVKEVTHGNGISPGLPGTHPSIAVYVEKVGDEATA